MKNAIIFDLDGTLWNATYAFKDVYDITMKKDGEEIKYTLKDFESIMGSSPSEVIDKIINDSGWSKDKTINFFKGFYNC